MDSKALGLPLCRSLDTAKDHASSLESERRCSDAKLPWRVCFDILVVWMERLQCAGRTTDERGLQRLVAQGSDRRSPGLSGRGAGSDAGIESCGLDGAGWCFGEKQQ